MVKLAAFRVRLRRRQSLTLSLEAVVNLSRSAVLRCIRRVIKGVFLFTPVHWICQRITEPLPICSTVYPFTSYISLRSTITVLTQCLSISLLWIQRPFFKCDAATNYLLHRSEEVSCRMFVEGTTSAISAHMRGHGINGPDIARAQFKVCCSVCGVMNCRLDLLRAQAKSSEQH
ncbi:hypothetical protein BD769DRAFT_537853 [Suillus cothurnatus]|nr:hypothetical protein BD769DRAFT_537853 [Suillus cothurnatus]